MIQRIVSGGQTGADRAGLDAAIELGIDHGGWVPRGRIAEDGVIDPGRYPNLRETTRPTYPQRTRRNVRDSDTTLIFSHGPLTGGSAYTHRYAQKIGKPCMHVDLDEASIADLVSRVREWVRSHRVRTVNIAGPRESGDPLIYGETKRFLLDLFSSP